MRAASQHIHGKQWSENGRFALLLLDLKPAQKTADSLYLRYALVTRGPEEHLFPSFLLDDWGREIRGMKLYRWMAENGEQFPRAELFGYEHNGSDMQCFLRALELYARFPLYVYEDRDQTIPSGVKIDAVLLPQKSIAAPTAIKPPASIGLPLRRTRARWWHIPEGATTFDFTLLTRPADPGY